jgi:hypothetical protein
MWILTMPKEWHEELQSMIQRLDTTGKAEVLVPSDSLQDAVNVILMLEAARRISFTENVMVTSNSDVIGHCVK